MNKVLGFAGRHKVMVAFLILAVGVAAWWHFFAFSSATWRYKMTVTVETPEGLKTGSAVREVHMELHPWIMASKGVAFATGEAVIIDLGKHGLLFGTLGIDQKYVDQAYLVVSCVYGVNQFSKRAMSYYSHLLGYQTSIIGRHCYMPPLVMFKDIKDPKTVTAVDIFHLAGTYGEGVALKDITIEMTDEPVTWEIDKSLVWLKSKKMSYLSGEHINGPRLYEQLHGRNFQTGENK